MNLFHYLCSIKTSIYGRCQSHKTGIGREEAYKQMAVTPSTVSKWCTNSSQPDLPSLLKIADLLEVDIKELIVREYKKFLVEQEMNQKQISYGKE